MLKPQRIRLSEMYNGVRLPFSYKKIDKDWLMGVTQLMPNWWKQAPFLVAYTTFIEGDGPHYQRMTGHL